MIRPLRSERAWLKRNHPDVRCSYCAYCGVIGSNSCLCYDNTLSKCMNIPYSHGMQPCEFRWELKASVKEALNRIAFFGDVDKLPPLIQDAIAILEEGIEHDDKIEFITGAR